MSWLIGAGLHPKASQRTLTVAQDLARRMDYQRGTVLYDMAGTAARLNISLATVKRHVRILRELGALAWAGHGTCRNLHLPGRKYAGTATTYAAVIPPCYDEAMGHRIAGTGYEARIIGVTEAGRERAVAAAGDASAARSSLREPPSPGRYREIEKAEVSGELKDTPRKRARRPKQSASNTSSSSKRRSPLQAARDIAIARQVRPLVGWTQTEGLRRLAYALRPLIDQDMDAHTIAAELHSWHLDWRPARPAAYITAQLRHRAEQGADLPQEPTAPTPVFRAALAQQRALEAEDGQGQPALQDGQDPLEHLTRAEIIDLRSAALTDPGLVIATIEELGERNARRLYTSRLVDAARLEVFGTGRMVPRPDRTRTSARQR